MASVIKWSDLELINNLGEGQAGVVWSAMLKRSFEHLSKGSLVAVKVYKSWVLEEAGQFERIIRELELGRKIRHPNLVRSLTIVRDPDGKPALIMAYYAGETLEHYLEAIRSEEKQVGVDFAFQIIGGLASALDTIHKAGAIHRDVKPANVIINDGNPILMDLGVIRSNDYPERTTSGAFLGTIRYAAPEYLFGEYYDSRIDIYSLGAIVFELFIGNLFYGFDKHWARLIAAKRDISYAALSKDRRLSDLYGNNVGSFVGAIIDYSIAKLEARSLTLENLSDAINKRLWEKAFYFDQGKLIEGEPKVHALGDWTKETAPITLKEYITEIERRLSNEDKEYLHRLLETDYWFDSHVQLADSERIHRLINAGVIRFSFPERDSDPWFEYHNSVKIAYRYGYL